jgi:hypothetical protein
MEVTGFSARNVGTSLQQLLSQNRWSGCLATTPPRLPPTADSRRDANTRQSHIPKTYFLLQAVHVTSFCSSITEAHWWRPEFILSPLAYFWRFRSEDKSSKVIRNVCRCRHSHAALCNVETTNFVSLSCRTWHLTPLLPFHLILCIASCLFPLFFIRFVKFRIRCLIIQQEEDYFHKQPGLKFMEETSKVLHLEHSFVWCWNMDTCMIILK